MQGIYPAFVIYTIEFIKFKSIITEFKEGCEVMNIHDFFNIISHNKKKIVKEKVAQLPVMAEQTLDANIVHIQDELPPLVVIRHSYPVHVSLEALNLVLHNQSGTIIHKESLRQLHNILPVSAVPISIRADILKDVCNVSLEAGVITEKQVELDVRLPSQVQKDLTSLSKNWLKHVPAIAPDEFNISILRIDGTLQTGISVLVALRNAADHKRPIKHFTVTLTYLNQILSVNKPLGEVILPPLSTHLSQINFTKDELSEEFDILPIDKMSLKIQKMKSLY